MTKKKIKTNKALKDKYLLEFTKKGSQRIRRNKSQVKQKLKIPKSVRKKNLLSSRKKEIVPRAKKKQVQPSTLLFVKKSELKNFVNREQNKAVRSYFENGFRSVDINHCVEKLSAIHGRGNFRKLQRTDENLIFCVETPYLLENIPDFENQEQEIFFLEADNLLKKIQNTKENCFQILR